MNTVTSSTSVAARVAERLAQAVGSQRYSMWFDRSARLDYDEKQNCLQVTVPNQFVADWIGKHFEVQLRQAAESEVGGHIDLEVQVDATVFRSAASSGKPSNPIVGPPVLAKPLKHSLDQFIVGPSNELAFVAAHSFADEESGPANTLYVHGRCGLGKTHLLQGVCRRLIERRPAARVHYTTAEQFTNQFLSAMRANRVATFRRKIRRLDLLAVDDVHFLAGKQATQQEFLHSFDAMDNSGARVVMASDSHPKLVQKLSEALISRCMRGMVVQIKAPDMSTRIKIVKALAQRRRMSLLDGVISALARRCQGSVREIEGTLTKLHALTRLASERQDHAQDINPIGQVLLQRLFDAEPRQVLRTVVSVESIIDAVANQMRLPRMAIVGSSRRRPVILGRAMVVHLARKMTSMSYPEIATALGRSSHSSLIAAVRKFEKQLADGVRITTDENEPVSLEELVDTVRHHLKKIHYAQDSYSA